MSVIELFHPLIQEWFTTKYGNASPPQELVWPAVFRGENVLVVAPTGSGKTLAAFLMCLNILITRAEAGEKIKGVQMLYISPLKALNNDIMRNLEEPLAQLRQLAYSRGIELPEITVDVRTGDTPSARRAAMLKNPPHILITTPESLYLLLTGPKSQDILRTVNFVIIDEIHAICGNKRGVHLSISLERLSLITKKDPLRIGLSATQRPLERVAAFLGGTERSVTILDAGMRKDIDLSIISPVPNWKKLESGDIWDGIGKTIMDLMEKHRSMILFVNSRISAERVTTIINDAARKRTGIDERVALCHHGSLSREVREEAEQLLKSGQLRCLVATATMELGIDVGFVDVVVQLESPKSAASGLQRVGRAGHLLHATSKGCIIPKTRIDLLESFYMVGLMERRQIEETRVPEGCPDVIAQQIVAMASLEDWSIDDLLKFVRKSYCYRDMTKEELVRIVEMLSGRTVGGPLGLTGRPRIIYDKLSETVMRTDGSRFVAMRNAGTIPDLSQYKVVLQEGEARIGELFEEFVYESRIGDTFTLGNMVYRINGIDKDKVLVSLTSNTSARMPFWRGDINGRSYEMSLELSAVIGKLVPFAESDDLDGFKETLESITKTDYAIVDGLWDFMSEQIKDTGAFPDERTIVVEYFKDEFGDSRGVIHSIFGKQVNSGFNRLINRWLLSRYFSEPDSICGDNGILYSLPKSFDMDLVEALKAVSGEDIEAAMIAELRTTPAFATMFRQAAVRSLVFSRPPQGRMPLWMARIKSQGILEHAMDRGREHPLIAEALRECLAEVFDLPGILEVARGIRMGTIRIHEVRRNTPSPLVSSYNYDFTGQYLYQPDISVDPDAPKHSVWVMEPLVVEELHRELDPLDVMKLHSREGLSLALDMSGEIPESEITGKWGADGLAWADELVSGGLVQRETREGKAFLVTAPDVQEGLPESVLQPYLAALRSEWESQDEIKLVKVHSSETIAAAQKLIRPSAHWVPLTVSEVAERYGFMPDVAETALRLLERQGLLKRISWNETAAAGVGSSLPKISRWCRPEIADEIHKRSLAYRRRSIVPVELLSGANFQLGWMGALGSGVPGGTVYEAGVEGIRKVIGKLQGCYLPPEAWEGLIFPSRIRGYQKAWLDELCGSGEVVWAGLPGDTGLKVALYLAEDYETLIPWLTQPWSGELLESESQVLDLLINKGAQFITAVARQLNITSGEAQEALRGLAVKGLVSNDTFSPIRFWEANGKRASRRPNPNTTVVGRWFPLELPAAKDESGVENLCMNILNRYGILCREMVGQTNENWTFSSLEATLCRMEEGGKVSRGYIVKGLSGMQFSLPTALSVMRQWEEESRENLKEVLIPLIEPGAALYRHWLEIIGRPGVRAATSCLVLSKGHPVLLVENGGARLTTLDQCTEGELEGVIKALKGVGKIAEALGGKGRFEIQTWDDQPITQHHCVDLMLAQGFTKGVSTLMCW